MGKQNGKKKSQKAGTGSARIQQQQQQHSPSDQNSKNTTTATTTTTTTTGRNGDDDNDNEDPIHRTLFKQMPWGIYTKLSTQHKTFETVPPDVIQNILSPLKESELDEIDFTNNSWDDTLIMHVRATGWYNVQLNSTTTTISSLPSSSKGDNKELFKSKLILLIGRSALHLAALSHVDNLQKSIELPNTVRDELNTIKNDSSTTQQVLARCLAMAISSKTRRSVALTVLARTCVLQATQAKGVHARPGMATAYLSAAECELMRAEIEAAMNGSDATKVRPADRIGPWFYDEALDEGGELPPDMEEEMNLDNWEVSVPTVTGSTKGTTTTRTYLADYWWGQSISTAGYIASQLLLNTIGHIERYRSIVDDNIRKQLWTRECRLQRELERRGAATVASLDVATKDDPEQFQKLRELVVDMRRIFAGTPYEPSEDFVKSLAVEEDDDDDDDWHVGCLLGMGEINRTLVNIVDNSGGRYQGYIIGSKITDGPNPEEHYYPPAEDIYNLLLKSMAGAGGEERCHCGPPRRPRTITLSYRLRHAEKELSTLLNRVNVTCELDSKENLEWSCANNQTDFVTGKSLDSLSEEENQSRAAVTIPTHSLVGQLVGIQGLRGRKDLNGRIGRVIKWHEDQGRWQVELQAVLSSESGGNMIAIKPDNLCLCPQDLTDITEHLEFQEEVKSWAPDNVGDENKMAPILERLQGIQNVAPDDVCAICIENFETKPDGDYLYEGKGTRLPCNHCFHIHCLLRWITPENAQCPCCRASL